MHYAAVLHQYGGKSKDVNSNLYNFDESNMASFATICQYDTCKVSECAQLDFCALAEKNWQKFPYEFLWLTDFQKEISGIQCSSIATTGLKPVLLGRQPRQDSSFYPSKAGFLAS